MCGNGVGSAPAAHPGGLPTPSRFHTCSLHPPPGARSQSLLLGGFTYLLLTGSVSLSCFGIIRKLVTLKQVQPHVTRAAFLDHTHHLLVQSQLRPRKAPSARAPWLCLGFHALLPGPSLSCPLQGHQELPPVPGRLSALSEVGLRGVRWKKQKVPVGPPSRSTVASTHLLTSSLWMDRGSRGPQPLLVLVSYQRCPQRSR